MTRLFKRRTYPVPPHPDEFDLAYVAVSVASRRIGWPLWVPQCGHPRSSWCVRIDGMAECAECHATLCPHCGNETTDEPEGAAT